MRKLSVQEEYSEAFGERYVTGVPCGSCGEGVMFGQQSGLWD